MYMRQFTSKSWLLLLLLLPSYRHNYVAIMIYFAYIPIIL